MQGIRNLKMPPVAGAANLARALIFGGVGLYGASQSIYNVEGGHRAIVFNRFSGIKSDVRPPADFSLSRKVVTLLKFGRGLLGGRCTLRARTS